jgi:hypothetical protein
MLIDVKRPLSCVGVAALASDAALSSAGVSTAGGGL